VINGGTRLRRADRNIDLTNGISMRGTCRLSPTDDWIEVSTAAVAALESCGAPVKDMGISVVW
jgi:hypothetical protein